MAERTDIDADALERAERAEAALEEALEERNRLWAALHERAARDRELEYYRRLTGQMESSVSWRLTAPLRAAKTLALRARKALSQSSSRR